MPLEEVIRRSYGKLVALLAARTGDVAAAEDALSEAFAEAVAHWPKDGAPASPEAWLLTVARRKWVDVARARGREQEAMWEGLDQAIEDNIIPDRRLALLFVCTHPAIDEDVRAPLMLQTVLGLSAEQVGTAFLVSPAAMGKRLVRAKAKIRQAGIPFRPPEREDLAARLDGVLTAIYAAYSEGWMDASGTSPARRELAGEAVYLAQLVVELLPEEAEAMGLLALLLHVEARREARRDDAGEFVPLDQQNRKLWDWAAIEKAEALLRRAAERGILGRYQLEAAVQSAHVARCRTGRANWPEVLQLYDGLLALTGSPVAGLNRAVAFAEVEGAAAGLAALERMGVEERLRDYQPYWAARAELLAGAGAAAEARQAYEKAIGLERDPAVRRYLRRRAETGR
jgi:RNA polymerase sigma-70 factor (ECF subfamily)